MHRSFLSLIILSSMVSAAQQSQSNKSTIQDIDHSGIIFGRKLKCEHSRNATKFIAVSSELNAIFELDQNLRWKVKNIEENTSLSIEERKFKKDSLWDIIFHQDSINLLTVEKIIDKYGWLSSGEIGSFANSALFLVIQHSSSLTVQEKYLPIIRAAVRQRKCPPQSLALLEDRVSIRKGKRQIYGSQLKMINGTLQVLPIEDPDNVDSRRAEVGLQPLAEYLKFWDLEWNLEEHKKQTGQTTYIKSISFWLLIALITILVWIQLRKISRRSIDKKGSA